MRTAALFSFVVCIGCGARTPLDFDQLGRADGGPDGKAPSASLCPPPPAPLTNDGTQPNAPNPTLEIESARGAASWLPGPADAHLAWSFAWSGNGNSEPAIDRNGRIYALETEAVTAVEPGGKIAWTFKEPGNSNGTAMIGADGNIRVMFEDFFEGVSLATLSPSGKLITAKMRLPGASVDSLAIGSDGVVYTGGNDDSGWQPATVYAVSGAEATALLSLAPYDVTSAPALADHVVYVIVDGYMLYAVSTSGALLWKHTIEPAPLPVNLRAGEGFAVSIAGAAVGKDGTIYAIGAYGHLRAFLPAGAPLWSFQAPIGPCGYALDCRVATQPPIITSSQIVWPDLAGDVHAVALDGTPRWTRHLGTGALPTVALAVDTNETIYWVAPTQGGALSKDGADLFSWPSDGSPNGVAITFGETAVITTSTTMYAIQSARCAN